MVTIEGTQVLDEEPPEWDTTVGITDAVAGFWEVTIQWGSATDEDTPPVEYLLYVDTDDEPWDQVPVIRLTNTPYTFYGLLDGQEYWFGVRCQDSADPPNRDNNDVVLSATPDGLPAPDDPQIITIEKYLWNCLNVAVSGSKAYIAEGDRGVRIIDLAHPSGPSLISSLDTTDARSIVIGGNYAYIADGPGGLQIADISDVYNPEIVSSVGMDFAADLVLVEDYVYVAAHEEGLVTVKVTDPTKPSLRVIADTTRATQVAREGNYLYLADSTGGLIVFDITTRFYPIEKDSTQNVTDANGVDVKDMFAYVTDKNYGLKIVNVSDPEDISVVGTLATSYPNDVVVMESTAFVVDKYDGLFAIDVGDPFAPLTISNFDIDGNPVRITLDGVFAFIADSEFGLRVINVGDPGNPSTHWEFEIVRPTGVAYHDDYTLITDSNFGLRIFDISDPYYPYRSGGLETNGGDDVVIKGGLAYFVGYFNVGLNIIDATNLDDLYVVGSLATNLARGVDSDGSIACIAATNLGLKVVDVSDPEYPLLIGTAYTSDSRNVVMNHDYAFIADGYSGLQIVDIEDPYDPVIIGSESITHALGIAVQGDYAYVAADSDGLVIVDVGNPSNPHVVDQVALDGANDLVIYGRYAFVACSDGLAIVDILNPHSPDLVTIVETDGNGIDVAVAGNYAYLVDDNPDFTIIELWSD